MRNNATGVTDVGIREGSRKEVGNGDASIS